MNIGGSPVTSNNPMPVAEPTRTPLGYVQLSGLNVVRTLPGLPPNATRAVVQVEAQPVRMRDDGADPAAVTGFLFAVAELIQIDGTPADLAKVKFIETAASAKLNISYYG